MDRLWQWVWDRYGPRYSWALYALMVPLSIPVYLLWSFLIVAVEKSGAYVEAAAVTVVAATVLLWVAVFPGSRERRVVERWAAGQEADRAKALAATYAWTRKLGVRTVTVNAVLAGVLSAVVGAIAGATGSRLVQYVILGVVVGTALGLIAVHTLPQRLVRPARVAIAGDSAIGDSLPRSHPTFATWSNVLMLAVIFAFAVYGAMVAAALDRAPKEPVVFGVIGLGLLLGVGVPITVGVLFSPSLQPIRDLAQATERVTAGDYSQRLPVVQDDDLGALAASFNRMQAGLTERQRLQAAFGTYVDPVLAARLLEQGDDVFTGERREVTVMFVDVRDFTPFAEANTAEDTVSRLNALFEIVVPAVVDAGGHVNKFLGDGALAVFGAPNDLADHADAAVSGRRADSASRRRAIRRGASHRHRHQHRGGDRRNHRRRRQTRVHPHRRHRQRRRPRRATHQNHRRRDPSHPAVRRRLGVSTARTHRPGIPCPERKVSRRAGLRPRPRDRRAG